MGAGLSELFSWQQQKAEVEFLVEVEDQVIPVEVKSGNVTKMQSLKVFAKKYTPSFQVIFSGRPLHIEEGKSVHHYPLYLAGWFPLPKKQPDA